MFQSPCDAGYRKIGQVAFRLLPPTEPIKVRRYHLVTTTLSLSISCDTVFRPTRIKVLESPESRTSNTVPHCQRAARAEKIHDSQRQVCDIALNDRAKLQISITLMAQSL